MTAICSQNSKHHFRYSSPKCYVAIQIHQPDSILILPLWLAGNFPAAKHAIPAGWSCPTDSHPWRSVTNDLRSQIITAAKPLLPTSHVRSSSAYRQRRIRGFRATGETRHVPGAPGSWDLRYPLAYQKRKSLHIWLTTYFSGVAKFRVTTK